MATSQTASWEVREVRVDYITVTIKAGPSQAAILSFAQHVVETERQAGNEVRPLHWMGYSGLSAGQIQWGERDDGLLVRCSGGLAACHWRTLVQGATNVTRIDLAVTARDRVERPDQWYREWRNACDHSDAAGSGLLVSAVRDNKGGATVYVGSRTSEKYGRVYNKAAESKAPEYARCWRWELEAKGDVAKTISRQLLAATDPTTLVSGTVAAFFAQRGSPVPWVSPLHGCATSVERHRSDNAIRLEWFAKQVRPSVAALLEAGEAAPMLEALGLLTLMRTWGATIPDAQQGG